MKKNFTLLKTAAAVVKMEWVKAVVLSVAMMFVLAETHAQSILLADLDESEDLTINEYSSLTAGDGRVYFIGQRTELWTSSKENAEVLVMLKKFKSLSNLTVVGATLYFTADDGVNGKELWRSNGTEPSTVMVKDIRAGAEGSGPEQLTNLRGTLYFVANDGVHGKELWRSNGSTRGTTLVKDVMPRGGSSNPAALTAVGAVLFFSAKDAVHGTELWKTNGTPSGTNMVKDIRTGTGVNSTPSDLVNVYGTLFFVAADANAGRELWKSDGTESGTVLVKDIAPGSASPRIQNATAVYRTLFFTATDGIHGQELWKSDGTAEGTVMVKDMTPGPEGSQGEDLFTYQMGNFKNIAGTLYYTAYLDDEYYIWKSNGTAGGTSPVAPAAGAGIMQPRMDFQYYNNRIYFFNRPHGGSDYDPLFFWSMDRSGGDHQMIAEFQIPDAYNAVYPEVALVGQHFYLAGQPDPWYGYKMLISDGTREGTRWIEDIRTTTEGSDPKNFTMINGKLYFSANDTWYGNQHLFETDGTPEGTKFVLPIEEQVGLFEVMNNTIFTTAPYGLVLYKSDIQTRENTPVYRDYDKGGVSILTHAGDQLFLATEDGGFWTSDGTEGGTQMLYQFDRVKAIYPIGNTVILIAAKDDVSLGLWVSDGTVAGTRMVERIRGGSGVDNYYDPHAIIGNTAYFTANDGVHGSELWRSDGTANGTYMVKDLNTSDAQDDIRHIVAFNDELYISALGEDGKWGLFKSDGTATGTAKLKDVEPIAHSIELGEQLLLFSSVHVGHQISDLWITDGSAGGTQMVADLNESHGEFSHAVVDGIAYFSFMEGGQLWRSDGTECGTFMVDLGSRGASPIAAVGEILVFGSYDAQAGFEPHAYNTTQAPTSPCSRTVAMTDDSGSLIDQRVFPGYPNPFRNDFSFTAPGADGEITQMQVFTLYGEPVEDLGQLRANTEHRIGQSWPKGIYVLQVMRAGLVKRYRVVKE